MLLHLTALPGGGGIGSLGRPARRFLDWMQDRRLGVWQFLPTGPTGFGNSPYQPLSVFAGNPLLIDLPTLVDWQLLRVREAAAVPRDSGAHVDFARVAAVKQPLLECAADRLLEAGDSALADEFEVFCDLHAATWLDDFAAFAVLKSLHGNRAWPQWGSAASDRRHDAVRASMREHRAAWERARAIQFLFARQWRALREEAARRDIVLFGDVPIYTALDCAEAWASPGLLALDERFVPLAVAGVPPDYFSADGQLWGNPLYRWDAHAADGYQWWIARLRHALTTADLVRLDHFRAFEAYWSVPAGASTARGGHWVPGPGRALFDALASAFGQMPCVAEDLCVITDEVIALRKAYALPGMQVLQFLVDQPDFDAGAIAEDCVCYTGTHDNDTAEGWFAGSGGRMSPEALSGLRAAVFRNVEGSRESVHKAMINLSFKTDARMAIAPLQDYLGLGSEARFNTPGQPEGNWDWRVSEQTLESCAGDWVAAVVAATQRA